jgi:hypothetical protein
MILIEQTVSTICNLVSRLLSVKLLICEMKVLCYVTPLVKASHVTLVVAT